MIVKSLRTCSPLSNLRADGCIVFLNGTWLRKDKKRVVIKVGETPQDQASAYPPRGGHSSTFEKSLSHSSRKVSQSLPPPGWGSGHFWSKVTLSPNSAKNDQNTTKMTKMAKLQCFSSLQIPKLWSESGKKWYLAHLKKVTFPKLPVPSAPAGPPLALHTQACVKTHEISGMHLRYFKW